MIKILLALLVSTSAHAWTITSFEAKTNGIRTEFGSYEPIQCHFQLKAETGSFMCSTNIAHYSNFAETLPVQCTGYADLILIKDWWVVQKSNLVCQSESFQNRVEKKTAINIAALEDGRFVLGNMVFERDEKDGLGR
jgi:hypothetical protein